ncbi:hypothetical protein ACB092_05G074800 [Castanea dentata]
MCVCVCARACVTLNSNSNSTPKKKKKLQLYYSQSAFTFIQYKKNVRWGFVDVIDIQDLEHRGVDSARNRNSAWCMPIGHAVRRIHRGKEKSETESSDLFS